MALFVDTTVWSLALRRDVVVDVPEVRVLKEALAIGGQIVTTGLVLQELLQGFTGPKAKADIIDRFAAIPLIAPDRADHIAAAELRNACRRAGVQVGTVDAILAQLCIRHKLSLLSTDNDFRNMSRYIELKVWSVI
jgi:predicted nucleic acid-binding protein